MNKKTTMLRQASHSEMLLSLHTLWINKVIEEYKINNNLTQIYNLELVELSKNEITVKSLDGDMVYSIKTQ
jgi:hypothetical protein